ncbi:unnamed protein product [Anisakis simplex]|uniref:SERPIN domain-containing protein n=1 Tax=Anisakis simplex TaxID=6269 RepID=A0A0M3JQ07_ANISI|nr:unnamed protein product [Anisakis simplex]
MFIDAFVLGLANFSKLSTQPLQISDTLHKAFIEVSEEGTEAAAATAIIVTRNAETPPKEFIANRPFMFVIAKQEQILFIGRFTTS